MSLRGSDRADRTEERTPLGVRSAQARSEATEGRDRRILRGNKFGAINCASQNSRGNPPLGGSLLERRAIRESPLPPAVSSSREHTWRLCRSFATLKDDSKGGVASYATEGSRRADDIRAYDVYVIMVGDGAFDVPRITIEKRRAIHESALDNRE